MIIGVPKESYPGERRVALVPAVLPTLTKAGFEVHIQTGAGIEAGYPDSQYADKGAKIKIVADRAAVFAAADIVVQILCYGSNDITGKQDVPLLSPRSDPRRISASVRFGGRGAGNRARWRHRVFRGADAPHYPRSKHGRALFDGNRLRIQGGADGRRHPSAHLSPCSPPRLEPSRPPACS